MHGIADSVWEQRWRTLRALESRWPDTLVWSLHDVLVAPDNRKLVAVTKNAIRTPSLVDEVLDEAEWAANVITRSPTSTFDDVYHAALFWRLWNEPAHGQTPGDRGENWVYRGENKCFAKTTASMHRLASDSELDNAVRRLEKFVDTASMEWPWLDVRQLIAVAQHYGGERLVDLQTWLLDITWDPYVALFFASYGWQTPNEDAEDWETKGRVSAIKIPELKEILPDRYYVDPIRVTGFSRIRNQRALFFDAPDPSILDECSPWRTEFRQVPGLVFTDPGMSISEDFLLAKDTPRNIERWEDFSGPEVTVPRLGVCVRKRPVAPSFTEIATKGLRDKSAYLSAYPTSERDKIIKLICATHIKMRNDAGISHIAIHSLHDAVASALSSFNNVDNLDISAIMDVYVQRSRYPEIDCIKSWIDWARELWDQRNSGAWILGTIVP